MTLHLAQLECKVTSRNANCTFIFSQSVIYNCSSFGHKGWGVGMSKLLFYTSYIIDGVEVRNSGFQEGEERLKVTRAWREGKFIHHFWLLPRPSVSIWMWITFFCMLLLAILMLFLFLFLISLLFPVHCVNITSGSLPFLYPTRGGRRMACVFFLVWVLNPGIPFLKHDSKFYIPDENVKQ